MDLLFLILKSTKDRHTGSIKDTGKKFSISLLIFFHWLGFLWFGLVWLLRWYGYCWYYLFFGEEYMCSFIFLLLRLCFWKKNHLKKKRGKDKDTDEKCTKTLLFHFFLHIMCPFACVRNIEIILFLCSKTFRKKWIHIFNINTESENLSKCYIIFMEIPIHIIFCYV